MRNKVRILSIVLLLAVLILPASASDDFFLLQNSNNMPAVNNNLAAVPWLCTINNDLCNNLIDSGNGDEKKASENNITIVSWSPETLEDVYVNDTVSAAIEYSITTTEPMVVNDWTIDKVPVDGVANGSTASIVHKWDVSETGFHTITYKGNNIDSEVEFSWYFNVYETGKFVEGNIFNVMDDVLENHAADIKIRMFESQIEKGNGDEFLSREVINLNDEKSDILENRESLREELRSGLIEVNEYTATLKQIKTDEKINKKITKKIVEVIEETNDGRMREQFYRTYNFGNEGDNDDFRKNKKENVKGIKGTERTDNTADESGEDSEEPGTVGTERKKGVKPGKNNEGEGGKSEGKTESNEGKSEGKTGSNEGKSGGKTESNEGKSEGKTESNEGKSEGKTGDSGGKSEGKTGSNEGKSEGKTGSSGGKSEGKTGDSGGNSGSNGNAKGNKGKS